MRNSFRHIARVVKAHGRRGEVVTVPVHGLPPLMRPGLEVAIVPPGLRDRRWHMVVACASDDRTGDLVALSGVTTLDQAEELVGKAVLARVSDLPGDLALHDPSRLIGREVTDLGAGVVGVITEVLVGPANDAWVIRGETGELLLPVIDDVVSSVPEDGPIPVSVPAGLSWEVRAR